MKHWILFAALVMLNQPAAPQAPTADVSNTSVRATIYLPDAESGYYRGTRFDWSGVISSLKWNGHEYFGQWFEKLRSEDSRRDCRAGRRVSYRQGFGPRL